MLTKTGGYPFFRCEPAEIRKELRFSFMKINENVYEIVFMSDILGVSAQGYYNYLKSLGKPYKYELLLAKMHEIITEDECNDTYGSMRMWEALHYNKSLENCDFPDIPHEHGQCIE